MRVLNRIQKEKITPSVLYGAGVIQIVAGALYGFFYGRYPDFDWREWVYVFAAPIYFALGFVARRVSWISLALGFTILTSLGIYLEERRHYVWADGRILEFVIFCLFLVSFWHEVNVWELRKGRPPRKTTELLKLLLCSFGAMISFLAVLFSVWQINFDLNFLPRVSSLDLESGKPPQETIEYLLTTRIRHMLILALTSVCLLTVCVLRLWSEGSKRRKFIQSQKSASV